MVDHIGLNCKHLISLDLITEMLEVILRICVLQRNRLIRTWGVKSYINILLLHRLTYFYPASGMGGSIGIVLFSPLCQAFWDLISLGVVSLIKALAVLSIRMNIQYKGSLAGECRTVSALPTNRHVDISLGSTIVHTCQKMEPGVATQLRPSL